MKNFVRLLILLVFSYAIFTTPEPIEKILTALLALALDISWEVTDIRKILERESESCK